MLEIQGVEPRSKVIIDWLSFTTKIHSISSLIELLGMQDVPWEHVKGMHGYRQRYYFGGVSIHHDGADNMGIWVEMSGQGCRTFETFGHGEFRVLFRMIIAEDRQDVHITRLDLAYDDMGDRKLLNIDRICKDVAAGNYVSRSTVWRTEIGSAGECAYIGSQKSPVLIRIYDKACERHYPEGTHWIRVETQLRDDRALQFIRLPGVADSDDKSAIGSAYAGVLRNYLRFVSPSKTDVNKWRWKMRQYWSRLLDGVEALRLYEKPGVEYNLLNCEHFVYSMGGNAIRALIELDGVDLFLDKLNEARKEVNPNPKYGRMIAYELLRRAGYDEINNVDVSEVFGNE